MSRNRRYRVCGATIESELPLPLLARGGAGPVACAIASGHSGRSVPDPQWFHRWYDGRRPWLSIGRRPPDYLLRFTGMADFAVRDDGSRIVAHASDGLPPDTLTHLLVDQVLPRALSRQGRLVLHASAVHLAGVGTVAFVGGTGRGKSTLAAAMASAGGRIVTDDCLAIEPGASGAIAHPGYPGLRLWPGGRGAALVGSASARVAHYSRKRRTPDGALSFYGRRSPLRALFILSPRAASGPAVALRRCRPATALVGLVRFAYLLDIEDRRDLARIFATLADVVRVVPVFRLRVRRGHRRLRDVADGLLARATALPRP